MLEQRPDLLGLVHPQQSYRRIGLSLRKRLSLLVRGGEVGWQLLGDFLGQHGQTFVTLILELVINDGELPFVGVHQQVGQHLRVVGGVVRQQVRRQGTLGGPLGPLISKNVAQRGQQRVLDGPKRLAPSPWHHLRALLLEIGRVEPIRGYDESYLSIRTPDVLALIQRGDPSWEQMVPAAVAEIIKAENLFGWRPRQEMPTA
jgi:hypothetical protein